MDETLEVKIKFDDIDDLKNFMWVMKMAKEMDGTLPPLACGLISSILKRLEVLE